MNNTLTTEHMRKKAKENGISPQTLCSRIHRGVIPELLFSPVEKINLNSKKATNFEAWGELTPSQLETMREFDQLGRIAKC